MASVFWEVSEFWLCHLLAVCSRSPTGALSPLSTANIMPLPVSPESSRTFLQKIHHQKSYCPALGLRKPPQPLIGLARCCPEPAESHRCEFPKCPGSHSASLCGLHTGALSVPQEVLSHSLRSCGGHATSFPDTVLPWQTLFFVLSM